MATVLVTGGTGFVGRHVVDALTHRGHWVRALVRSRTSAEVLEGVDCELVRGDVTDAGSLLEAADGCDAIVHLVAIITGKASAFDDVIAGGARNVVAAAQEHGVGRLVHMSALGVSEETKDTVPYYRAKWDAEQTVAASRISHAIMRPSFVFGDGGALQQFAKIARLSPVTPIVGDGHQRIQPIWVEDVARAFTLAVESRETGTFELGGPEVVDWNEFWRRLTATLGTRRPKLHVPFWLMRSQALFLERLPNPPVTRDQLTMLRDDNVVSDGGASMERLGLRDLVPLDEQLLRATARDEP